MDAKLLLSEAKNLKVAGMVAGISGAIFALFSIFSINLFGGINWYQTLAAMFLIVGYVFAFQAFGRMGAEKPAKQLKLAALLAFCAMACINLPVVGKYFAGILCIVAAVFFMLAAKALKMDEALPEAARAAFKLIFIAAILEIVAAVLVMLPLISIVGRIIEIAFWVLVIVAAVKIGKAE